MWRRIVSSHLRTLAADVAAASSRRSIATTARPVGFYPTANRSAISAYCSVVPRHFSSESVETIAKKKVEDVMPIATGHEKEEFEAELEVKETMTLTTSVKDFVVNQRNGVKGLVDSVKLTTLPSAYIQPPQERLTSDKILSSSSQIPVIDVSNWNDPHVATKICDAAAKLGLFQIVNHGIAPVELNALIAAARGFFELSAEERRRYWRGSSVSETAWLTTSFNPYKETVLEWRDFLKFEFLPRRHDFSDTWPPVCKEQVTDHFKRINPIANKILNILINNLNSTMDESNKQTLMGTMRMNFNYYPECPEPSLALGTGRHSDINSLTLLLQEDGVLSSLYARATEGGDKWINVPPIPGAIVVNIGDVLQIMSNDRYKSVEHCVLVNKLCSRVSIPVFCGPVNDSVVESLAEALEKNEIARYRKVVYSDYLKGFFERPHDGKKTIESIKL